MRFLQQHSEVHCQHFLKPLTVGSLQLIRSYVRTDVNRANLGELSFHLNSLAALLSNMHFRQKE